MCKQLSYSQPVKTHKQICCVFLKSSCTHKGSQGNGVFEAIRHSVWQHTFFSWTHWTKSIYKIYTQLCHVTFLGGNSVRSANKIARRGGETESCARQQISESIAHPTCKWIFILCLLCWERANKCPKRKVIFLAYGTSVCRHECLEYLSFAIKDPSPQKRPNSIGNSLSSLSANLLKNFPNCMDRVAQCYGKSCFKWKIK